MANNPRFVLEYFDIYVECVIYNIYTLRPVLFNENILISICNSMQWVVIVPQHVFPHFMQLKHPIACSQEPTTSPCPEPYELRNPANL
jgi:hypothetical protein